MDCKIFWRVIGVLAMLFGSFVASATEVNVYSARKENLLRPLLDVFSKETGIVVHLLAGKGPDLLRRLKLEQKRSVADLFLALDVGDLVRAMQMGLLQPAAATGNLARIPAVYRDAGRHWFGLSVRARTIVYKADQVRATGLPGDYFGLADAAWRGRLCVRSSDNGYNQSLVAALLHHYGSPRVENWVHALTANFARPPQGNDRDQIRAVAAGQCDLALVNTYYLGIMRGSANANDARLARQVKVHWLQQGHGVHINLSGGGIVHGAAHAEEAAALLNFLAGTKAQNWFVTNNYEFSVRTDVTVSKLFQGWEDVHADSAALRHLAANRAEAVRVMDRGGWR